MAQGSWTTIIGKDMDKAIKHDTGVLRLFESHRNNKIDTILVKIDPNIELEAGCYYELTGELTSFRNIDMGNRLATGIHAITATKVLSTEVKKNETINPHPFLYNNFIGLTGVVDRINRKSTSTGKNVVELFINITKVNDTEFLGMTKLMAVGFNDHYDETLHYSKMDTISLIGRLQSRDYINREGKDMKAFEITIQDIIKLGKLDNTDKELEETAEIEWNKANTKCMEYLQKYYIQPDKL